MLLVVTVICRMVQMKKWAPLPGECPPLSLSGSGNAVRKIFLIFPRLCEPGKVLLEPCAWLLARLSALQLGGELKHRCPGI